MNTSDWSAPSARIKSLLKEKGLTQQDLANMMTNPSGETMTLQNVKQLLNKPSMRTDTLKKIADALDVPMWELFVSRDELAADCSAGATHACPHCGKPIHIKIEG